MAEQKNAYETGKLTRTKQSLAQREDFAGQAYRTIRDNPKTSAAIATGVAAAAAGAGAFLFNRKQKTGSAFGHASASDDIVNEVKENNNAEVSHTRKQTASELEGSIDAKSQSEIKSGSVSY